MPDTIASVTARELDFGATAPFLHSVAILPPGAPAATTSSDPPTENSPDGSSSSSLPPSSPSVGLRFSGAFIAKDFHFKLTLRMSSLKHAYLPVINLKVTQLALGFVLDARLVQVPSAPFVDHVKLTFAELPSIDLRVRSIVCSTFVRSLFLRSRFFHESPIIVIENLAVS
jgi:hypothetical protein